MPNLTPEGSITEGGRLTHDAGRLRVVARQMLANVFSCSLGRSDSGLVARIAGDALGADAHIGNMAAEDFLGCLSKAGIEKVGSSLRVLPRPRAKETRAKVIKQASGSTYVHPAALFALTEAEIALHGEAPRDYSWGQNDPGEGADEFDGDGGEDNGSEDNVSEQREDALVAERDDGDADDVVADENAHPDDDIQEDERQAMPARSRPARRKDVAAA
jgi:ParB family transcriptional regulator, chromosome partitioning protein